MKDTHLGMHPDFESQVDITKFKKRHTISHDKTEYCPPIAFWKSIKELKYKWSNSVNLFWLEPVAGGWVVSVLDCYARSLVFQSSILTLLKDACGEQWPAAMLAIKRFAGVIPEVNLWEHISHMSQPRANKTVHSGFETQRRCHQKSKTWISVAP